MVGRCRANAYACDGKLLLLPAPLSARSGGGSRCCMRLVGVLPHQAPRAPASRMAAADERWATRPVEEGHSLIRRRTSSMRISAAVSSRREVRDEDGSRQTEVEADRAHRRRSSTRRGASAGSLLTTETATHRRFLRFWMIPVASERVADPLLCSCLRWAFSDHETGI